MAQIKIYGLREHLDPIRARLSNAIHSCVVDALSFPADKPAHRFVPLSADDFYFPASATPLYPTRARRRTASPVNTTATTTSTATCMSIEPCVGIPTAPRASWFK